jgi:septin family protein
MKALSFKQGKNTQICICGVDGAGKKSFASVFFSERACKQQSFFRITQQTKKLLIIVGSKGVFVQMAANDRKTLRYTGLSHYLELAAK